MTPKEREALAALRLRKKEGGAGVKKKIISSKEKRDKEVNEMWQDISEWSQCGGGCPECSKSRERFRNRNYREER